ncbi:MAG: CPXCG motif-containing cysteine-rich protein [Candidatus Omnitrophica bacterium]|nr:CPXCG motif-containing cysteine-rich protein [Candidatus Omnitrophota bacterium]
MIEEDYLFNCPYCFAEISIRIDMSGGRRQSLIYECEICSRAMEIRLELDEEGNVIDFFADQES